MLEVLAGFLYMLLFSAPVGLYLYRILMRLFHAGNHPTSPPTLTTLIVTGLSGITVYTGIFSIFYKIDLLCHLPVLLVFAFSCIRYRKELFIYAENFRKTLQSWDGFVFACAVLVVAFYTSRGSFHTDTNIYHAAAIRFYEEYGLIKGQANLQLHYGYNSAYLALAAFFSMHFLFPHPWHITTGFLMALMLVYTLGPLKTIRERNVHRSDGVRCAVLLYLLTNLTGAMSPATDYGTMLFALYTLLRFMELAEVPKEHPAPYALVGLLAVLTVTMKLSAAALVLLLVYPAVCFLRQKQASSFITLSVLSVLIALPYFIRNVLLTGWLIYPFAGLDLFDVMWKVPREYLILDSDQIKVWARGLYDVARVSEPVSVYLPVWWEAQSDYAQSLLYANLAGTPLVLLCFILKRVQRKKVELRLLLFYVTLYASAAIWFFLAPFVRYGLCFLLVLPALALGDFFSIEKRGFGAVCMGFAAFLTALSFCRYIANYASDDLVFLKRRIAEPYYLIQQDYDRIKPEQTVINGISFYYPTLDEINSYYNFPGTCYSDMLLRSTLIGEDLKDGLKPK